MARRPLCTPGQVSGRENGTWRLDDRGYTYDVEACALVRPTSAAVRQCLAGRHLLFIGDSLSRYLYLTLAHLLVHDVWPDDASLAAGNASVCHEMTWLPVARALKRRDEWNVYFEGTNAALRGLELCDCQRERDQAPLDCENRYLRLGDLQARFETVRFPFPSSCSNDCLALWARRPCWQVSFMAQIVNETTPM